MSAMLPTELAVVEWPAVTSALRWREGRHGSLSRGGISTTDRVRDHGPTDAVSL